MKLDSAQIHHIANLARLKLTEDELDLYGGQLSDILSYIEQLQEVNTDEIEPTAQITGLVNVLREDKEHDWDEQERDNAIKEAPELEENQIKVKRVL